MMGHQNPCETWCRRFAQNVCEPLDKVLIVLRVFEYRFSFNPPYDDVMQSSRCIYASFSWHVLTLQKPSYMTTFHQRPIILISKIYYFQPILANCRVDITIFILYRGLYWIAPVGAWCRINSGPICCYSFPAVIQPCQP